MPNNNVMVDLETLGTVPGCAILSVGAVDFSSGGMGEMDFYEVVNLESCKEAFLEVDPGTERWWSEQSSEAREVLTHANDPNMSEPLKQVLQSFSNYLSQFGTGVQVWGNGSDFDNAILAVAFNVCKLPMPWRYSNGRCYRTLKNLYPDIKLERLGIHHDALADAQCQARHAALLLRRHEDAFGAGSGAGLQSQSQEGAQRDMFETHPGRNRVSRQNVPTGLPPRLVR